MHEGKTVNFSQLSAQYHWMPIGFQAFEQRAKLFFKKMGE